MSEKFAKIDDAIAKFMYKTARPSIRISFAIIFIWFGILKPLGVSPAEDLVKKTVSWMGIFSPETWLHIIGYWEVVIGILFLFKKTSRSAIGLLFLQMVGTFLPLITLPEITFQNNNPLTLTLEGQYIVKNILIISAALIIGGDLYYAKKQNKK